MDLQKPHQHCPKIWQLCRLLGHLPQQMHRLRIPVSSFYLSSWHPGAIILYTCFICWDYRLNLIAEGAGTEGSQEEFSESFAFALVNGALGVFEVHGRRIRDFRYGFLRLRQIYIFYEDIFLWDRSNHLDSCKILVFFCHFHSLIYLNLLGISSNNENCDIYLNIQW